VLIVDDNDAMQNSLTNLLEELGQQVRSARDGEEALRIARDWQPDLVLLDINLPKLNGYRVARELRAQFPPARMAMVMMSGEDPVDALRRGAADAGVDRYVDKIHAGSLIRELLTGNAA
jgi:CheY-like chemotaxis protein